MARPWPPELADECVDLVLAACLTGEPLAPIAREWLLRGLLATARNDEARLEESLGLTKLGEIRLRGRLQLRLRDEHLSRALQAVAVDEQLQLWPRCTRLVPEVRRFVADVWPRVRRLNAAPGEWPACRRSLFAAAATGRPLPTSATGLRDAYQRNARFSLTRQPGSIQLHHFL
jgi:hypothetical protein